MKIKTSIVVTIGCLAIFLFLMLPVFVSMEKKQKEVIKAFKGSSFSLKDVNDNVITEESFEGPLTAIFFGFTNCPDVCPLTLNNLDLVLNSLDEEKKNKFKVFFTVCFQCLQFFEGFSNALAKLADTFKLVLFDGLDQALALDVPGAKIVPDCLVVQVFAVVSSRLLCWCGQV